jgi:ABC-type multidrug transport system fused ATPase/permease subunit
VEIFKKFYLLLNSHQRRDGLIQFLLMLVGMVFETLGIGLLVPVLTIIAENDIAVKYPSLVPVLNALGNPGHERLVVYVMLLLVLTYVLKMIFLSFLAWKQSKYIYGLQAFFSQKLFTGYLYHPYTFHLQRNSSQLIRNVTSLIAILTSSLTAFLVILTELFTFVGIFVFLVYVEPIGTLLVIGIFGITFWLFHRVTKKRLLSWGNSYQVHEEKRILHLQQGLGGAKDVKLLGREENFLKLYSHSNIESASAGQKKETLAALPRLWLELLMVSCMAILLISMVIQGRDFVKILPTLGIFTAAAFRMMPSINRMMQAFQNIRFAEPAVLNLKNEIEMIDAIDHPKTTGKALQDFETIRINNIFFRYPSVETYALNGVSLEIKRGTTIGIIGTSGAGKSTLVDVILGLLSPEKGAVELDGIDIKTNIRSWQNHIGYVPQSIFLTDDTLRRNIAFALADEEIDEEAVNRAIASAQLKQFVAELPEGLETIVGERGVRLSGGQRQRIGIARALYHDPSVLVLDEATSSLDSFTESGVMDAVRELHGNKTLIIVAHRLTTVEQCDYIYRLGNGKVTDEGKTSEVLEKYQQMPS